MEIVELNLDDKMNLKIEVENFHHLNMIKEFFTSYVDGFQFMPQYKCGNWDGKVCMVKGINNLPYGLLFDLVKEYKKNWKKDFKLIISDEVKNIFRGPEIEPIYDLKLKPYFYQDDCIKTALKYTKGIIRSATACHKAGDKVLMYDGCWKNIEDINAGDYVIGKDGLPKKVLNTYNGFDDIYIINPKNNRKQIYVTKNHILHLTFTNRGGKYNKKLNTFENISVENYLNESKYYKHLSKLYFNKEEINFKKREINCKLSPYFIGLYIGDGGSHSCSVYNIDKECINEIYYESSKFNMEVKHNKLKNKYGYFIKGKIGRNNIIFEEFKKIGIIFGCRKNRLKCENRFIPKIIFNQSIDYRKEVLAGLIDSDGHLSSNKTYYDLIFKSKQLVDDIELLSISLGLVCSRSIKIINGTNYYRIFIMGNISKIPVRIKRKQKVKNSSTDAYKSGFNIEYIGKDNFYGIQVEDSLYITNGGMVTHNSGKSLIITYIIKTLLENNDKTGVHQSLIIVPSKSLVEQFKNDMIDYGLQKEIIGKVYSGLKQWDKEIVVTTWQTLKNNIDKIGNYGCIIVDECHSAKAHVLKEILSHSYNSNYRIGFTGTMHQHTLDNWNTQSYLGPIIKEYSSGFLAEEGYIAKCNVHLISIDYGKKYNTSWNADYNEAKEEIFNNEFRLNFIYDLVNNLDHNVLLLVGLVKKEGQLLESYLNKLLMISNDQKVVKFLSGKDDVKEREIWRKKCMSNKNIALIATYGIFQQGINIPNLKYIIFASPFKSKIRVLQSIGRSLRKHVDKEKGSQIFDIVDNTKYFKSHGESRLRFYDSEGFNVKEFSINESIGYNIKEIIKL